MRWMEKGFILLLAASGAVRALEVEIQIPEPDMVPSEFREATLHHKIPCSALSPGCLALHLMYLQCGAILIEKMTPMDRLWQDHQRRQLEYDEERLRRYEARPPSWYAYSIHGGPRVLFLHAGYFLPEFFDPSLPARRGSGGEFDPLRKTGEAAGAESFHPSLSNPANRHLANFIQSTIDWLDSQEKTLVDACELRAYWKEHRSDFSEQAE